MGVRPPADRGARCVAALVLVLPPRAGRVVAVVAGVALGLLGDRQDPRHGLLRGPAPAVRSGARLGARRRRRGVPQRRRSAAPARPPPPSWPSCSRWPLVALVTLAVVAAGAAGRHAHRGTARRRSPGSPPRGSGSRSLGVQVAPGEPLAARSARRPRLRPGRPGRGRRCGTGPRSPRRPRRRLPRHPGASSCSPGCAARTSCSRSSRATGAAPSRTRGWRRDGRRRAGRRHRRSCARPGFAARSGFLTSPTVGGGSWLAHSTLLSGLWIDNQQRYRDLVASDRLTLDGAFAAGRLAHRRRDARRHQGLAGGQLLRLRPGSYDSRDLGYHGPHFSWAPMPDQYALAQLQRLELRRAAATRR